VESNNQHIYNRKLEYSTVQFNLNNPTPNSLTVELDTNILTQIPNQNTSGVFPNTLGQTICGGIQGGMYYNPTTKKLITGGADSLGASPITQIIDVVTGTIESILTNSIYSLRMKYASTVDAIYSIQVGSGIVSVINPSTGAEITTISTPSAPATFSDLAFNPIENKLYLMDRSADQRVYVLDVITNTYLTFIALAGFSTTLAYSPINNRVYVGNQGVGDRFAIIDCVTDTQIGGVPPIVATAEEMVYNTEDNVIYFNDFGGGNIRILDVSTDLIKIDASSIIPFVGTSTDMTYSSVTNTIWAVNVNTNISIINCNTNVITSTLPLPDPLWNGQVEYAVGINTVYTSPNGGSNCIQQIDTVGSVFNVVGSTDINLWIRDSLINPKQIDRIKIYAENNSDLLNPLTVGKEDANGIGCSFVELPNISAGVSQIQSEIGQIDFDNYIFDVTSYFRYTIPPFTTIKWVIYYKQYDRSDLLAGTVMVEEFDAYKPFDPDTYDEKFLIDTKLRPTVEINKILNVNNK
jgi:YVTN family beta-propeller protein